jgi:hypothetical protein
VAESEPRFASSGASCVRPADPEAALGGLLTAGYGAGHRRWSDARLLPTNGAILAASAVTACGRPLPLSAPTGAF